MTLSFLRGDAARPRGHAIVAFRVAPGSPDAFVTYAVVLPIIVDPMKYLPPAFAAQFQGVAGSMQGLDAVPMPPIPEAMSVTTAMRLAERRDDDFIDAGVTDGTPIGLMTSAQEAVRQYAEGYRDAVARDEQSVRPPDVEPFADMSAPEAADEDSFRWLIMGERQRIDEMTRLVGRLRDAVERGIRADTDAIHAILVRLASTLPLKYRANELALGAVRPGADGTRLAGLYLERCYRMCNEQYEGLADIDREIARLETAL